MARPRNKVADQTMLDVAAREQPLTVRRLFYCLTDPTLPWYVPKTEQAYRNQVVKRCKALRELGFMPYSWIIDTSRTVDRNRGYGSLAQYLETMRYAYHADVWSDLNERVSVWCESKSTASIVRDVCRYYGVDVYATGGDPSRVYLYDAAKEWATQERAVRMLWLGDFDKKGGEIPQSLMKRLTGYLPDDYPLSFERVLVTEEQIEEYALPTKPGKDGDRTVEAETMPTALIRRLLSERIESHLPTDWLDLKEINEVGARAALESLAKSFAE